VRRFIAALVFPFVFRQPASKEKKRKNQSGDESPHSKSAFTLTAVS
jgi:hypothetical protein